MKRTITGWIRKDNLNKPFFVDRNSTGIDTLAATGRKFWINDSTRKSLVRVKITVETVEPKKRTQKLVNCAKCGGSAAIEISDGTDGKWFYVECTKCINDSLPEPTMGRAIELWNAEQKGKA